MKGSDRFFVDDVTCGFDGRALPVANLSVGGFYVAADRLPVTGQVLEMTLAIGRRPPCTILGRVTWINQGGGSGRGADLPPGFGVKIVQMGLADKVALLDVLKRTSATRGPARS